MNIRQLVKAVLCSAFLATSITSVQAETLTVYGDETYPPIIYLKEGKPAGILPAILHRLESVTGDTYELKLLPWKRAYMSSLKEHAGIVGISDNQERRTLFSYSDVIYDDDIQVVVLKGKEFSFNSLEDLRGRTVGVTRGASYGEEVDAAIRNGLFKIDEDSGDTSRLLKLVAGRFDAAFVGNSSAGFERLIRKDATLSLHKGHFVVLPRMLTRDPLHLAIPLTVQKPALMQRFNAALAELRKSGELKQIAEAAAMD